MCPTPLADTGFVSRNVAFSVYLPAAATATALAPDTYTQRRLTAHKMAGSVSSGLWVSVGIRFPRWQCVYSPAVCLLLRGVSVPSPAGFYCRTYRKGGVALPEKGQPCWWASRARSVVGTDRVCYNIATSHNCVKWGHIGHEWRQYYCPPPRGGPRVTEAFCSVGNDRL